MTATILSFGRRQPNTPPLPAKMPWQNQDLAELYRVRDRLCAAGLDVEVEAGVADEGDPWFVYVQAGTDNVVVHIARIDSEIHVINCVTGGTYKGTSFREVSDRMLEDAPLALSTQVRSASNVVLHPSAFLTAFVAAAIMLVDLMEHGRAEAATAHGDISMPNGEHGHAFLSETRSGGDDAASSGAIALSAEPVQASETPDGSSSRRITKEASTTAQPIVTLGPVAAIAPVGVATAVPFHAGFLAEVPGVGASVTLAAGILAAELARSFTSEEKHASLDLGSGSFVHEFTSLLTAFVSVDAAHAKVLPNDAMKDAGGLSASAPVGIASADIDLGSPTASHVDVAPTATTGATLSVKSVPDGVVEHAVFAPASSPAHKANVPPTPVTQATAATSATPDSSHAATSSSDNNSASVVAPMTIAATTSAASIASSTNSIKTDVTKDTALDLAWIVSQLVKHDAVESLTQKAAVSLGFAGMTVVLKDDTKDQGATAPSSSSHFDSATENGAKASNEAGSSGSGPNADGSKTDSSKAPAKLHDTHDVNAQTSPVKGSAAKALVDGTTLTPAGGTITLEAGHHETVVYKAGSTLILHGFVFGEDYLSFDTKLGDVMAAKAHADGTDLVLGDLDTGTVRLVGVLADPDLLSHHGEVRATAA